MAQLIDPTEAMFTAFEPKTQNRFIMYIDGIPAYLIKKSTDHQLLLVKLHLITLM